MHLLGGKLSSSMSALPDLSGLALVPRGAPVGVFHQLEKADLEKCRALAREMVGAAGHGLRQNETVARVV